MIFSSPEAIASITPQNPFDRFADGRPQVSPDDLLERMRLVTNDEAWGPWNDATATITNLKVCWLNLHPERVLVGRAVTAMFVPQRPDLHDAVEQHGRGRPVAPPARTRGSSIRCCRVM